MAKRKSVFEPQLRAGVLCSSVPHPVSICSVVVLARPDGWHVTVTRRHFLTRPLYCSAINNPLGDVLAGPLYNQKGILTAEIDIAEVTRGKYDFDVVGHYALPDVFRLEVNEEPNSTVVIK